MTRQTAWNAVQRVCQALSASERGVDADVEALVDALVRGRDAVLAVPFSPEHLRHYASQRQQYASWGWDTPSIDEELRALDQTERQAILETVRRARAKGIKAVLDHADADLNYCVAKQARVVLRQTRR